MATIFPPTMVPLEDLVDEDFAWQEGWEYRLG
jgi:hypothetical protein